ncbi:hypothetical protein DXX93_18735 [Thalassotalea euphylliae]|uniref:Uncharacterized protein n=1 Tax=Thalassotalea euphylliae TaxID=1655234 RepID=A0A3E0TVI3_9GAMM|nr:hypothetical protein DXX93_18735 [Thalassotalea euphylliae]
MNSAILIFLSITWFVGLFIGWFFRNGTSILGVIVLIVMSPVFVFISDVDWWPLTLAFVLGLLTHTWKPIYRKIQQL